MSSERQLLDRLDDEVGLLELVAAAVVDDLLAALAVGPQPLVLAVAVLLDDGGRGVEDHLGRAVVLLEPDDLGVAEVVVEVDDVAQVGAAPLVDRLVGIADDRRDCGGSRARRLISRYCGRLVSWYSSTITYLNLRAVALAHLRGRLEQLDGLEQQVVEVERVALAAARRCTSRRSSRSARRAGSTRRAATSGPSMRFFAWLMRDSACRGGTSLSSMPSSR